MQMRIKSSPVVKTLTVVILIVFVLGISLTSILALLPQKVSVPDFTGLNITEATALAGNNSLTLKVISASSADYGSGQIISQNTAAGESVGKGTVIEVRVNR